MFLPQFFTVFHEATGDLLPLTTGLGALLLLMMLTVWITEGRGNDAYKSDGNDFRHPVQYSGRL